MTETFGVFAGSPVSEDTVLARLFRRFAPSGVVRDGEDADQALQVTADGTAEIRVRPGYAIVGGYWYRSTEDVLESPDPNGSSQSRRDLVVVRADPTAGSSVDPGECAIEIVTGTPGSSTAPDPERDPDGAWEVPLAEIVLEGNSDVVNSSAVTDAREYTGHGAVPTIASRPHAGLGEGGLLVDTTTGRLRYVHDDALVTVHDPTYPTDWQSLPLSSGYTNYTGSGHTPQCRLLSPTRVELRGTIARTNGGAFPSDVTIARVPSGMRPSAYTRFVAPSAQTSDANIVRLEVVSTATQVHLPGQIRLWRISGHTPDWVAFDGWEYEIE